MFVLPDESISEIDKELILEKSSLRRFLTGLTATTFGVLVALHPKSLNWWYVSAIVLNAISTLFFIASLFGRYRRLCDKKKEVTHQASTAFGYTDSSYENAKWAKRFHIYTIIGITAYIFVIITSCIYIILEMIVLMS